MVTSLPNSFGFEILPLRIVSVCGSKMLSTLSATWVAPPTTCRPTGCDGRSDELTPRGEGYRYFRSVFEIVLHELLRNVDRRLTPRQRRAAGIASSIWISPQRARTLDEA